MITGLSIIMQLSAYILWVAAPSGFQGVGSNNMPKVWTIKGDIMEHVPSHKIWVPDKLTTC